MAIRYVNTGEVKGMDVKTFSFGAYRGSHEVEGKLYYYDDGSAKINLPYFKCLSFKNHANAEDFIEKNFSCKGDLVKAVVDREVNYRVGFYDQLKPSCVDYYDSKYSFKRERGVWGWEIRNVGTKTKVGYICKNNFSGDYSLSLGRVQVAVCTTRPEAEKLAKQILNKGASFADTLYAHEWLRTWKLLDAWTW